MNRDYILSIIAGFFTALFVIVILKSLNYSFPANPIYFLAILPILWLAAIIVSKYIGRYLPWFYQLAKFSITGFLNTSIDFVILNFLMAATGIAFGFWFSVFKAGSFLVANINSYFWNQYWSFGGKKDEKKISLKELFSFQTKEYYRYFLISIGAIFVNVGVASLIVNVISPQFGASPQVWANVGAVVGAVFQLVWNFVGYKFIVFKA
ncbi:MAG: hypothetical protein A3H02_01380 [Candidatus Niyogibacteria bacterium RIFCSPLOWO2_12_FULL_41_13]|uniref:GtrA/DPMS transmembrane domain-containing protein n=1 Tax=Candidatus Niyogibacteria bacterium RIFCSPLOWO2_12_FULL_41_13 TaxID=1801726 RepID=A0A1G2F103_9BACT|nr:MAG: hypothetical protein A3H02_01380 [Candidatus Niyogibacteria bacterium RIFCSPLOWO2_12_FULL_41_13]